jgi:hypothetical protein
VAISVRTRWRPWTGAAVAAALADYADIKFRPVSQQLTNGEIVSLAAIAADVFGLGGRYGDWVTGASDWAIGSLVSAFVKTRLTPAPVPVPTRAAAAPAPAVPAGAFAGVPASGGSQAFDLPMGGF